MKLSPQKSKILSNASLVSQFIKNNQRISFNLSVMLKAVRLLSIFQNKKAAIAMAISISGNLWNRQKYIDKYKFFDDDSFQEIVKNL